MLERAKDVVVLLQKHLRNELTAGERLMLDEWASQSEDNRKVLTELEDDEKFQADVREFYNYKQGMEGTLDAKFQKTLPTVPVNIRSSHRWLKWTVAACALMCISVLSYLLLDRANPDAQRADLVSVNDIAPGTFKARLTLGDGRTIELDSVAKTGEVATQDNTVISNKGGQLVYAVAGDQGSTGKPMYNTLATARGETYAISLVDGSKVWLNAQSTLRFPVAFTGNERIVELNGEAYFEVVSNAHKPFRVMVKGSFVEVLGTRFSVASYADEPTTNTGLLEGKVKVISDNHQSTILAPGQQAKVDQGGHIEVVEDADVEGGIGWMDGVLHFSDVDIAAVLRSLARWYDVSIQYEGNVPTGKYKGSIDRTVMLSEVLENLELMTGIQFEIKDRTVIVKP